jgi:UDP-glucose 4-epimerase
VKKFGSGEAIRDWLYVEDAAMGVLAALKDSQSFSVFNFGTGKGTTLNELLQIVEEVTGRHLNIEYENTPTGDAIFAGVCDNSKAKKELGWEPKVDLRTGLMIMYEYMKKHEEVYE